MAHIFLNAQGGHFNYQLGSHCVNCVTSNNNEKTISAFFVDYQLSPHVENNVTNKNNEGKITILLLVSFCLKSSYRLQF